MHLLTTKSIAQTLQLTAHFLQCKKREFEGLHSEIVCPRAELRENIPGPGAASTLSAKNYPFSAGAPVC
ncbi:helix-turn-helix domain-containing protein [Polynucleobacter sp. HIN7]|uniref:hypothetical protein n=1 Tax=Polynucleobacter sp. HIN7 TaxID=3047866 RepID=UPI0025734A7C|nr:hypothetical protein [Polynucleobacter sp. HIN7]BEI36586.1 hypothetical protein PHIN7_03100 [Polynucleobacter sp. HIN7]